MSYSITSKCIGCNRCLVQCPQNAINRINDRLIINSQLCNDCTSTYTIPQCVAVCPANACFPSLDSNNYWETWFTRYQRAVAQLRAHKHPHYWLNWFERYNQKLTQL